MILLIRQIKEEGSPMVTEEEVTEKYNINDFLAIYFIIL